MGLPDLFELVREVDPNWLELTLSSGYGLSLAAWTVIVFALGCVIGGAFARRKGPEKHPRAEKKPSPRAARKAIARRRREQVAGFSRNKARAVLRAYEADGLADVGEYELDVIGSVQARDGIFVLEAMSLGGVTRTGRRYGLTDGWRAYLSDARALASVRERAGR